MSLLLFLIVTGTSIVSCVSRSSTRTAMAQNHTQTLMLHVIFRHGERTPASTYPNDPYKDFKFEPYGWGQLTDNGKQSLYELGRHLREKYGQFLGHTYTPSKCSVQTTDADRTKMSAQIVAAGLWQSNAHKRWDADTWTDISFKFEPLEQDSLLLVRRPCPKYSQEMDAVEQSEPVQTLYAQNKKMLDKLTNLTGFDVQNAEQVFDVFGTLTAEKAYGLELPAWTDEFFPDKMIPLSEMYFKMLGTTKTQRRLKGGVFIKHLIHDWTEKLNKRKMEKIKLYCGHDSTTANILMALNVYDGHIIDYAETIIFELVRKNGRVGVYVTSIRNNEETPLYIPNCGQQTKQTDHFCPLDDLLRTTEDIIPQDWNEECQVSDVNYKIRVEPPP